MGSAQRTPALSKSSSIQKRADILLYRPLILSLGRTGARGAYAPSQPLEIPYGLRRRIRPAIATTHNGVRPHRAVAGQLYNLLRTAASGLGGGGGARKVQKCKGANRPAAGAKDGKGRGVALPRTPMAECKAELCPCSREAIRTARGAVSTRGNWFGTQCQPYLKTSGRDAVAPLAGWRLGRYAVPTLPRDMRTAHSRAPTWMAARLARSANPTRGNDSVSRCLP